MEEEAEDKLLKNEIEHINDNENNVALPFYSLNSIN